MDNQHYLLPLFAPRSVAVVGATERPGALGNIVYRNIVDGGFAGPVYPVNPNRTTVFGRGAYRSMRAIGAPVDLAVIATPPHAVESVIEDAGRAGVRGAVILTAGFAELGDEGRARQASVTLLARRAGIRLLGPNCIGFMRVPERLNATFARALARPGRLALVSQSGAICTAILEFAASTEIGFSTVISLGAAADLDFGEILDFLIHDSRTDAILLYVEGIREARFFLSALRAAARMKPVIVLKTGRHMAGSRAATSHTGALVGNDRVFSAALQRSGTVRVRTYTQLFAAARILAAGRMPRGSRLAIVTNGGGPGVMAADASADVGVPLASLGEATVAELAKVLPAHWSRGNPVDIVGDATPERFRMAVAAVLADPQVDALLTLFVPQAVTSADDAATATVEGARGSSKPMLAAWLGTVERTSAHATLEAAHIPNFYTPENAVEAFSFLSTYRANQQTLLEVPPLLAASPGVDMETADRLRRKLRAEGRTLMTEDEAKSLVRAFGLPVPETVFAATAADAVAAAKRIGYPVAVKVLSTDITHKSDIGGVRLNLRSGRMVTRAFDEIMRAVGSSRPGARIQGVLVQKMIIRPRTREVLVGLATDPVFGPVITFGAGGVAVEALADTALMLPPLNRRLALEMIHSTRIARVLSAFRDYPAANFDALTAILLQISTLACALPWVKELDLNPVLVNEAGAIVVDARVVIDPQADPAPVRYRHMAIHPYPASLEAQFALPDGARLAVRPIRPEDARMEQRFVSGLSDQSRYLRFQHHLPELTPQMLARFTQIDYDREMALVAIDGEGDSAQMAGVARYVPNPNRVSAEFAIAIGDSWQGRGVGRELMTRLLGCAAAAGYTQLEGSVLSVNTGMLALMDFLGFQVERDADDPALMKVVKTLTLAGPPRVL